MKKLSIRSAVFIGLLLGISLPIFLAGNYILQKDKQEVFNEFENYRQDLVHNIAQTMIEPLDQFSPNRASLALEVIKQDLRVVDITVYDNLSEMKFISVNIPQRKVGNIYTNREDVIKEHNKIGYVQVSFSDGLLTKNLEAKSSLLIKVFVFTYSAVMLIMFPLLYLKILRPINVLLEQSKRLRQNKLESKFLWTGKDEINILGRSLDSARTSIVSLINELKTKNDELEVLYITDNLTGLFNRHKLNSVLSYEFDRSQRFKSFFGIIMLDIDYFKSVNDQFGHPVGDQVLKELANILQDNTRKTDIIGRWGGEEFFVIVPETEPNKIKNLAECLRRAIETHSFETIGYKTASFGVSVCTPKDTLVSLIARVDENLYKAKKAGRNSVYLS